jgi:hypothetical protein
MKVIKEDDFPDAYDVYTQDRFDGTIGLVDGKLVLSPSPDVPGRLDRLVRMAKDRGAKTDEEIYYEIPETMGGTVHIREVGHSVGLDEPVDLDDK